MSVPFFEEDKEVELLSDKVEKIKRMLGDGRLIEVHDFLVSETRRFIEAVGGDVFSLDVVWSQEELLKRLSAYESGARYFSSLLAVVSVWGGVEDLRTLEKCISRSCDRFESNSGNSVWLALRWYPLVLQVYCSGVSAAEAGRYDSLSKLLQSPLSVTNSKGEQQSVLGALGECISDLNRMEVFKRIPGHERNYVPLSEYLYKIIQPDLDELFFLGKGYDKAFDEFEVILALGVADLHLSNGEYAWGPVGRFGWKRNAFENCVKSAFEHRDNWPPLKNGMFGGEFSRFEAAVIEYRKILSGLHWY